MTFGKVYLVGAGPGDPELLTLKAVKALRAAEVLLVDDLVSDEVLAYASPQARIVYVGKRGGCKSTPQEFIERLMINEAKQGRTVVRLKGGDPFVFGRGGEECESLLAAGIQCEVVNGITAGLAAPTALGIPLTHPRSLSRCCLCHGSCGRRRRNGAALASARCNRLAAGDLYGRIALRIDSKGLARRGYATGDANRRHSERNPQRPAVDHHDVTATGGRYSIVRHRQSGHYDRR